MRLLRAELTKLCRPLLLWVAVGFVVATCLFAWEGTVSASQAYAALRTGGSTPPVCAPTDDRCRATRQALVQAQSPEGRAEALADLRGALPAEHPVGIGLLAAGMLASAPGMLALLLLAAGHVGGEWSGHTIKQVLTQEVRRWRVLGAKAASLWLAGVALLAACWAVLAPVSVWLAHAYPLPGPTPRLGDAAGLAGSQAARSLLVLAAFVALAVLAAVLTRGTLGTVLLGLFVLMASFEVANHARLTRGTLVYWVSGWMGFEQRSSYVLFDLWNDHFPGRPASHLAGLAGLAGVLLVAGTVALVCFARCDVTA